MAGSIAEQLGAVLQHSLLLAIPLAAFGGLLTGLNPCVYPAIAAVMAYVGAQEQPSRGKSFLLSLTFGAGLAVTFVVIGVFGSSLGHLFRPSGMVWRYVVAGLCLILGVHLSGLYTFTFPSIPLLGSRGFRRKGFLGAGLLGLGFGLAALPCTTPILALLFGLTVSQGKVLWGASLFFSYGIGHCAPTIAIGTFAGSMVALSRMGRWVAVAQRVCGGIMIVLGAYFLITA